MNDLSTPTRPADDTLCVGIDLGTTNSLVGAVIDGQVRLFADADGRELLPSVVGLDEEGKRLVGRPAKNRRLVDPEGTVVSVKRRMGTDDAVRVGNQTLTPVQVSAILLRALIDRVEAALGRRPARAVITVPALFTDAQRQATRDAGQLAGLTVERLVNEPTAAAMTYHTGQEQTVMVYDFGGGTFDVSVLDRDENLLEVRASRGDTHLGGDDVDAALVEHVLKQLGAGRAVVEGDRRALIRLTEAVERAKVALADQDTVRLLEPFLAGEGAAAVQLDLTLRRADLDDAARPLVERTLVCIDQALADARLSPAQLDRVLLVGGSSRLPLVRERVAAHLGRPVHVDLDADRAVALGASLLAGRASGAQVHDILVDITPHTLAIGALGERNESYPPSDEGDLDAAPVIPRNTPVPVERKRTLFTVANNQTSVQLPVVQGEKPRVGDNTALGHIRVHDLPPSPALSPVEVTFRLDLSGVLHVSAQHLPSGRSAQVTIADSPYQLSTLQRQQARQQLEALEPASPETTTSADAPPVSSAADTARAQSLLQRADKALTQPGDPAALERVRQTRASLADALLADAPLDAPLDALADALLDLL